ncbi:MAG: aldehyde dehydrogenase family protein, partial [Candidatus Marinimicrobia bacterium]|nr:aldehyde dehydrogenase family protein [Candidatus Neomarinimicrobiota bacterium]
MNKTIKWEYSPAPESTDHIELKKQYNLFINGKFNAPKSGKYFKTINPSNEKTISSVAEADKTDVDKAKKSAKNAYEKIWSKMPAKERGKYIFRIARLLQERAREFSVIETMDGGKPIRESRDVDIPLASAHFFYHAGWADKLEYAFPGRQAKPIGVAGQIIPWNFPLLMAAWKLAPALATGNTVVLKPAETTPLTALKLAEIIQEADLPPGVINVVTGAGKTGQAIVNHPDVNKIAFTGSTEVGKYIMKAVAGSGKKYTLEVGGKAANIIFEDAAIDQAVEGIINAIFFNQGHVCCAGSRLYIQEGVVDEVISKLRKRMETLIVGDPLDKNTDIGAINSKMQLQKIKSYVKMGTKEGGSIFQSSCSIPKKGFWHAPTIFTDVSQSNRIVQEEIFGPVLAIQTFRTVDEVMAKANNSPYGLS